MNEAYTESVDNTATPAKLRDGSWGARVPGRASVGMALTVRTKSGKSWAAIVTKVLWSSSEATLCATKRSATASVTMRNGERRHGRGCKGCRGPVVDSSHHRAMEGYCGSCAFDEFDC